MNVPVIAFFNNKGGVGKTSLVYHVAWMIAGWPSWRVVAADLDPQGNLTAAFLEDSRLEALWQEDGPARTIYGALRPLEEGTGDVADPHLEQIDDSLFLLPGDMALSGFEDDLSECWPKCLSGDMRAFRIISAFWRILQAGARAQKAHVVLVDLGPNLGAINRAALIAADYLVVPLGPDLYSLQGLRNLGPTLRIWRQGWRQRREQNKNRNTNLELPVAGMQPLGYVVLQHSTRLDRPVRSYEQWIARIPEYYQRYVLDGHSVSNVSVANDPHCLLLLKHYRSLMPMAQEARKPIFRLQPADGALGSHARNVQQADTDFRKLAQRILDKAGLVTPVE
ncbi:MAG: ParA family protein [Magnetococcales bacterium]|nr:ParA family protein [Magnetococcales bacterium]